MVPSTPGPSTPARSQSIAQSQIAQTPFSNHSGSPAPAPTSIPQEVEEAEPEQRVSFYVQVSLHILSSSDPCCYLI